MLIALETPQMVMMLLSFAGMLAFGGLALWLSWRQKNQAPAPPAQSQPQPKPQPAKPPAEREQRSDPPAANAPTPPEPELPELTEFIALPGQRELDSPLGGPEATAIVASFPEASELAAPSEPGPDKTEFIAARLDDEASDPFESTTLISGAELAKRQRPAQQPEPGPGPDNTEFIAPPPEPEPAADKTEFIAPPPAFAPPAPIPAPPPSVAVPTPPAIPAPQAPAPSAPGSSVDLDEHFSLAAQAFEQLQDATTSASLAVWRGHLEVLASIPGEQLHAQLQPELAGAPTHRWAAALLVLLHNKSWSAKRAFGPLLAEFDAARRDAAMRVLGSWDDPRAPEIAAAGLASADPQLRGSWLACFAERGWDPGAEAITAALADADPRVVSAGLRSIPRCEAAASLEPRLASHLFAADPNLRTQAVETALVFANNSAWLICRQLARNPSFPIAAELVGLLGTEADLDALRGALDAAPSPELLRGLGLCGRRGILDACVARFDADEPGVREAARASLGFAAGRSFESGAEANTWLDEHPAARLLGGAARSGAQVLTVLADAPTPLRRAIARELRVRSRGRLHLDVDCLPEAWRRQLERLRAADSLATIDFERGYPWTDAAAL